MMGRERRGQRFRIEGFGRIGLTLSLSVSLYVYIYVYIWIHNCLFAYVYIKVYVGGYKKNPGVPVYD